MSEPVRYDEVCNEWNGEAAGLAPCKDGYWVKYEDYARLQAEVERLKAEGDRLKEAGDEMAFHIGNDEWSQRKCADRWFDLREGKQS